MPLYKSGESGNPDGRPKGCKNKFKVDIFDLFTKAGYSPIGEMIKDAERLQGLIAGLEAKILKEEPVENFCASQLQEKIFKQRELKNYINKELAQYYAPKLKAIEVDVDLNSPLDFRINIEGSEQYVSKSAAINNVQCDENSEPVSS